MEFLSLMEIIGTVAFAVSGALVAIEKELDYYGIAFLAIITSVGGGILRDVFAKRIPFVFRKEVYAVACIIGAAAFMGAYYYLNQVRLAMYICFGVTLAVRLIAIKMNWHLAKVKRIEESDDEEQKDGN